MKTIYVRDIQKNLVISNEPFAVLSVQQNTDKNDNPYYNITLGDKTGSIQAKLWNSQIEYANPKLLKAEQIVGVTAKVDEYKGNLQLNILELSAVDETALDEFMETSQFDPDEMMTELLERVKQINHEDLQNVIHTIVTDTEVGRKLKYWPAGNSIHHGFRSGLLQHVLEMFEIADGLKRFYNELNYDVLAAGIIMHDIGKIHELSGGLSSNYTTEGGLLGHIVIGVKIFNDFGGKDLDENTKLHVEHLILSHHGRLEFGSPVVPATPEAIALHYIDNLSSKTRGALKTVEEITADQEFSRPNYYMEGARFWKLHNEVVNVKSKMKKETLQNKDEEEQLELT